MVSTAKVAESNCFLSYLSYELARSSAQFSFNVNAMNKMSKYILETLEFGHIVRNNSFISHQNLTTEYTYYELSNS